MNIYLKNQNWLMSLKVFLAAICLILLIGCEGNDSGLNPQSNDDSSSSSQLNNDDDNQQNSDNEKQTLVQNISPGKYGPFFCIQKGEGQAFANHRPRIRCFVRLAPIENNTGIMAQFDIWAREDQPGDSDWGSGTYSKRLNYKAPSGYKIVKIESNYASVNYVDRNSNWETFYTSLGAFQILGETVNNDLCEPGKSFKDTDDRTKFYMNFSNLKISLEKK